MTSGKAGAAPVQENGRRVWVAYQSDPPYLPVAVADTVGELALILGVPENNIRSIYSKHIKGKIKRPRYMCVYLGDE